MKKSYPIIGTKSSLLWDEDTDAWVYISGKPETTESPASYFKIIPTLYRAVDLRASAISNLPWAIMKGDTEYDVSEDYQNKAGLVANMNAMLYLIEASLILSGSAYWKREKNPAGYDKLRHLDPRSIGLDEKKARAGELVFTRKDAATSQTIEYTTKEIVYLWYPDPYVEIGPPSSWPVQSALAACGVLANLDEFARNYFGRGAIKAMLFAMQGAPRGEAERFESWWGKYITGIKNVFRTKVINAEKVAPVVVGEGMKELENVTISQEKREEIAVSMAIPMSILFANAANYATAERDKLNWYEDKVVPEAQMIAAALNEQVFKPLKLRLVFKPETLDIFQEDEKERALAMSAFMDALDKAGSLEMALALFDIYGVEVSKEAMAHIEAHYKNKEQRAAEMSEQLQQKPVGTEEEPEKEEQDEVSKGEVPEDMKKWERKAMNALKRGKTPAVDFASDIIPLEAHERILVELSRCKTAEDVRAVFANAEHVAHTPQEVTALLEGIKLGVEALKVSA